QALPGGNVVELFGAQAAKTALATAVVFGDEELSYRELDMRANQLAHHLRELGVGPERVVGLCLARSAQLIVGLLGILKAGGAYLPLDPDYPRERLGFMLADAGARVLITDTASAERLAGYEGVLVRLDAQAAQIAREPTHAPALDLDPHNPAYVIYTSGSTGQPKGTIVPHAGIPNLAAAQIEHFRITAHSRVLQFASVNFDASVSEIATALLSGAALIIPDGERTVPALQDLIRAKQVSHATMPPSVLAELSDGLPLKTLIVAGEPCPPDLVE